MILCCCVCGLSAGMDVTNSVGGIGEIKQHKLRLLEVMHGVVSSRPRSVGGGERD